VTGDGIKVANGVVMLSYNNNNNNNNGFLEFFSSPPSRITTSPRAVTVFFRGDRGAAAATMTYHIR